MATATEGARHGDRAAGELSAAGLIGRLSEWLGIGARVLRRRMVYVVPLVVLLAGVGLYLTDPPFLQGIRLKVFDLYQQLKPRPYVAVPVKIIDLDEASLRRMGQWPWPRSKVAEMLARLFNAGARVVAFDVVFAEADRTSPRQVLPVWLNQAELKLDSLPKEARDFSENIIRSIPDNDEVFIDVIAQVGKISRKHGVVAGFVLTDEGERVVPDVRGKFGVAVAGDDPLPFLLPYSSSATNLPEITTAATGLGSFNITPDSDSIVRRIPMVLRLDQQIYPSLSMEAIRIYQGASTYIIKSSNANMEEGFGEQTGINNIKIGHKVIPVDETGRMWVHFTPTLPERSIPAWKVFEDSFDPKLVEDHILFVGTSAAGLKDLRSTPLNPAAAGVEIHAQATEQILLDHFLERPDWARGIEFLVILGLGGILILATPRFGALAGASLGATVLAVGIFGSWYAYSEQRMLFDPIYPSLTVLLVYLGSTVMSYLDSEAEKRMVRGAFSQYLSPALVEQLAEHPERLRLGGEVREMTFLFCDVRGFTSISEGYKRDPQALTRLINRFLTPMTDAILERHGTIDKYMGDCIMAFWNAPLDDPEHAKHGCHSALAMFRELDELNRQLREEATDGKAVKLAVGIGLNTGECVVGNMGSEQRFDYSVLGDAVNLASRLESQSKTYGVGIVIGEDTQAAVPGYATLELDLIAVKGKAEAVRIYSLMGGPEVAARDAFQGLRAKQDEMLAAYRAQEWERASALVAECRGLDPELNELYELYQARIAHYRENPPGADWDGVFIAETK